MPSPQSTPTPEVAVHNEAAGGVSPSHGEQGTGVQTTDQSVAESKTPAQIIKGAKPGSEQDEESDLSDTSSTTVSDRFQERQRLFQKNYKPIKTPKELLKNIRKDRNRHDHNTPSNAGSTVIVLGTDAAGETIYDLTDEQLANCLSQPWSKWTSHFSPDGILQVDQSEKLESNI